MDEQNEPVLSKQTCAEMEAGRKQLLVNAAAFEQAEKMRAEEVAREQAKKDGTDADAAVAEALAREKEVFPVAKGDEVYQPSKPLNQSSRRSK
jgi:hypothetical protein